MIPPLKRERLHNSPVNAVTKAVSDSLNSNFLRVSSLKLEFDPRSPIFRRLESAALIDASQIASIEAHWRARGGTVTKILLQETEISFSTLSFFSNSKWTSHLTQHKRLGEYLQEASLVSEEDITKVLIEQRTGGYQLPLGVALSRNGFIKQTTADFFARSLVQKSKILDSVRYQDSPEDELMVLPSVEVKESASGYLLSIVSLWGHLERLSPSKLRKDLFHIAKNYSPNIVVDMSMVASINLATLRALISAANMCREWRGKLSMCGLNKQTHTYLSQQLETLGLESFPNRKSAIQHFCLY